MGMKGVRMKRILFLAGVFVLAAGSVFAQRIPIEFSVGIGGYFPHDGRYSHFFDHNPANVSVQAAYGWSVLDFKVGVEHLRKSANTTDDFSPQTEFFPQDKITPDSAKTTFKTRKLKSYVRATAFRFGTALHLFREAAFSPFVGAGGSISSSKGYGTRVFFVDTVITYADTTRQTRVASAPPDRDSVNRFSESVFGTYIEAGVKARLPYNFFFVFEAVRDFRANDKKGVLGPAKGGGTLIGIRLGYKF